MFLAAFDVPCNYQDFDRTAFTRHTALSCTVAVWRLVVKVILICLITGVLILLLESFC